MTITVGRHHVRPGRYGEQGSGDFAAAVERLTAILTVAALGMRTSVYHGITTGTVLAVLLSPVWLGEARRRVGARVLLFTGALAIGWGLALTFLSMSTHQIDQRQIVVYAALLVQFLVGAGALWWAVQAIGVRLLCAVFALGMLAQGFLIGSQGTDNPWKALYAVPIGVAVLGFLHHRASYGVQLAALLALAAASGLQDSRSYAATFLIAALLLLWQMRPAELSRRGSATWTVLLFGALGYGAYQLGQALLVAGYLGATAQQRTIAQIQQAGSLIYGGRPELSATLALLRDDPWGHGLGVIPSYHDVTVAKAALSRVLPNPNSGYVDNYMFGNDFELHSIFGDLWTHFGLVGIALVVLIGVLALRIIVEGLVERRATGLVLFLGCWTMWNLFFSPFYSALPTLTLLFGLALPSYGGAGDTPAHQFPGRRRAPAQRAADRRAQRRA